MNCQLSQLLLAFRPNELAADDRAALDAHLRACPTCAALANTTAATDNAIRKAMLAVPVPDGLRAKLHSAMSDTQRVAWRGKARLWGTGLAATVAVGLIAWGVFETTKPTLTSELASNLLENERLTKEQSVNAWLKSKGLPAELPEPFEYGTHAVHGTGPLGTLNVPFVLFQTDRGQCRVYILKEDAVRTPPGGWKDAFGSEYNIKVVERGGYVYLIAVSSTTTLEAFLKAAAPVA